MMETAAGAKSFNASGDSYDLFMGRYSQLLAARFADEANVAAGQKVLDVGCGPGALTGLLIDRVGLENVLALDPSPPFVEACSARFPGLDVRLGRAEEIPFGDATFDRALAQLVLHFVSDPDKVVDEFRRVVKPGGIAAACVWDFEKGMEMLRCFWDAALAVDSKAPDEARVLRFGRAGEIAELLSGGGLEDVVETALDVVSTYSDFDELWSGFMAGIGPAGSYCLSLSDDQREALRDGLYERLGSPTGPFTLGATARCAHGRNPL